MRVIARFRPLNPREKYQQSPLCARVQENKLSIEKDHHEQIFQFYRCYWSVDESMGKPPVTNTDIFDDIGRGMIQQLLQGINQTVISYGGTATGKGFSLFGGNDDYGLVQRVLQQICKGKHLSVKISMHEIYGQKFINLLHEDKKETKVMLIEGKTVINEEGTSVESFEQSLKLLDYGLNKLHKNTHMMNTNCTRAHKIIHITVLPDKAQKPVKITFADLAPYERIFPGLCKQTFDQISNTNKSLSNLGIVVDALAQNKKNSFAPIRNCLLTTLLADSLSPHEYQSTYIIAALSPTQDSYAESLATLQFVSKFKLLKAKKLNKKEEK